MYGTGQMQQLEMTDCYHKAEAGEKKFTLLARDRAAPVCIRMWAAIREGNFEALTRLVAEAAEVTSHFQNNPTNESQLEEACAIAGEMEQWRAVHR